MSYKKPKLVDVHWWAGDSESNNWIPTSSGVFPDDGVIVQVTFIGFVDKKPHCECFAYRTVDEWTWAFDDGLVDKVKITAWKRMCEPYIGD